MPSCPIPTIDCQTKEGSQTAYLWIPFIKPDGDPTDDIPALYLNRSEIWNESWTTGAAWLYQGWEWNPTSSTTPTSPGNQWTEYLQSQYFRGSKTTAGLWEYIEEGNSDEDSDGVHAGPITPFGPDTQSGTDGYRDFAILFSLSGVAPYDTTSSDFSNVVSPEQFMKTPIIYQHDGEVVNYVKGDGAPSLQGVGGTNGEYTHSWDIEEYFSERYENWFTINKEDIRNDAMIDSGEWPEPPLPPQGTGSDTTACSSSFTVTWPKISDIDPWPDPAVTYPLSNIPWKTWASGEIVDVRYRWKIPNTFTGSYFKITWDVLTEPEGWDATIDDPDYEPPDPLPDPPPPVPQIPKPGRPSRSYVQDLTAVWTGPGTGGESDPSWFTEWNDLNPPPEPGTRRVCNIRFECYRGPYGSKPQLTGEGVDLTEDTPLQKRFTSKRHAINLTH